MYRVKEIIEPDFGCEGIPENEEICCETVLEDVDSGDIITVKVPDAQLYEKCIAEGVFVVLKKVLTKEEKGGIITKLSHGTADEKSLKQA